MRTLSNLLSYIYITLLLLVKVVNATNTFCGIDILLICSLLLINPIKNLYCSKTKTINSKIYNLLLIGVSLYGIYVMTNTLAYDIVSTNYGGLYSSHKDMNIMALILLQYIVSLFTKKEITIKKDIRLRLYIFMFISSFLQFAFYKTICGFILSAFSIVLIIKRNDVINSTDYKIVYLLLLLIAFIGYDDVVFICLISAYVNLDRYGLNI